MAGRVNLYLDQIGGVTHGDRRNISSSHCERNKTAMECSRDKRMQERKAQLDQFQSGSSLSALFVLQTTHIFPFASPVREFFSCFFSLSSSVQGFFYLVFGV
ncbi:hypothetical protein Bca4012_072979 [Brassica carinata]